MKIQVFPLQYQGEKRIGIRPLGFDKSFPILIVKAGKGKKDRYSVLSDKVVLLIKGNYLAHRPRKA